MIKNIVFDMGMVLVKYDAMHVCQHFLKDEADQKEVCRTVFQSPEWLLLDMGVITEEDALKKMCARIPDRLHEAAEIFDGFLFSAEVKCIKPQKEMYEHFFNRFSLKPAECFFIDDLQGNIDGGKRCGMDGYCFADGDVEKLRKRLEQLN